MSESESETRAVINSGDGFASANTEGRFYGEYLKFAEGKWFTGQEQKPVAESRKVIATGVTAEWKFWKGKEVLDHKDASLPRVALGHLDETLWEPGLDGRPKDPWALMWRVDLLDPLTLDEYRFEGSNKGTIACVDELVVKVKKARTLDPRAAPIVVLSSRIMKTKFGQRLRPCLKVVGWQPPIKSLSSPGTPSLPSPNGSNDLSDAIPF
jgi:hypothetical protein